MSPISLSRVIRGSWRSTKFCWKSLKFLQVPKISCIPISHYTERSTEVIDHTAWVIKGSWKSTKFLQISLIYKWQLIYNSFVNPWNFYKCRKYAKFLQVSKILEIFTSVEKYAKFLQVSKIRKIFTSVENPWKFYKSRK